MTFKPANTAPTPPIRAEIRAEPARSLRVESLALYAAMLAEIFGVAIGMLIAYIRAPLPSFGDPSFATVDAALASVVAAVAGGIEYWSSCELPGQEWHHTLSSMTFNINTVAVVLVHVALAAISVMMAFLG